MRLTVAVSLLMVVALVLPGQSEGWWWRRRRRCSPVSCLVGSWQSWGTCSAARGRCEQRSIRSVTRRPSCGGTSCPSLIQTRSCTCPGGGSGSSSSYTCFGDITRLRPTGASAVTARQDGLSYTGVPASNRLVLNDYSRLLRYKSCFDRVGRQYCINPSLIAALASRESRAGNTLRTYRGEAGWGDCGSGTCRGYGLLQCDVYSSSIRRDCKRYPWNSCDHVAMMVGRVLIPNIRAVQRKHPTWLKEQQVQGGVAAYNFGVDDVRTWARLDIGTTGHDYSNDVIARAQYLIRYKRWN